VENVDNIDRLICREREAFSVLGAFVCLFGFFMFVIILFVKYGGTVGKIPE